MNVTFRTCLGNFEERIKRSFVEKERIIERIWKKDHTVWKDDPSEISNRLGWLESPAAMRKAVSGIVSLVEELRSSGFQYAVLLGMGGSSMAPEVFRFTFGVKAGHIDLSVLDSTDPEAVLSLEKKIDYPKTLFIVSTKSGGTVETLSFTKFFYNKTLDHLGADEVGNHFIAITDPGSGLEALANELEFYQVFLNDPDIGGRYSALSYFGLVPAALVGVDIKLLLERAERAAENARIAKYSENTSFELGVVMGELAKLGCDKLTLILSPHLKYFGAWLEQLIAESTGKEGKGILPVDGEEVLDPDFYAKDRLFISLRLEGEKAYEKKVRALERAGFPLVEIILKDLYDLGGEFFRWEIATAVAGACLGINPFDQPNVESAKKRAKEMVSAYQKDGKLPEIASSLEQDGISVCCDFKPFDAGDALKTFLALGEAGKNYVTLQAYLTPVPEIEEELQNLRRSILRQYRMATTTGFGPRFLHSTGQLHKGDGGHGLFIQLTADAAEDAAIPEKAGEKSSFLSFGVLEMAQALGDRQALLDARRRVIHFHFKKDAVKSIRKLTEILQ
jgi:glucose-6-phosphate isomerase